MSTVLTFENPWLMYTQFPSLPEKSPLSERATVVAIVVALHLLVFVSYLLRPEPPQVIISEMSISLSNAQMPQADIPPVPKQQPKVEPKPREPDPEPTDKPAPKEEAKPVQQETAPPSPVVMDTEPDYKADYLNNPKPNYPLVARRMGYHGKVVLDVEVLSEGKAGDIKIHQSSGYAVLDNSAIQTVRTWRFVPARHLGQSVTQRFLVPVKFSLEDEAS